MIYVLYKDNQVVGTTRMYPTTECPIAFDRVEDSDDWKSFEQVEDIAKKLTELTGKTYLATECDYGSLRFDIVEAPMIGEQVSYSFNGDYYPCGLVEKISKTYQITVSDGKVFRRKGKTGAWSCYGWSLVKGHWTQQNPSF